MEQVLIELSNIIDSLNEIAENLNDSYNKEQYQYLIDEINNLYLIYETLDKG